MKNVNLIIRSVALATNWITFVEVLKWQSKIKIK